MLIKKIEELKELSNTDFSKDVDLGKEWIDMIPIDPDKVYQWNMQVMKILSSISEKYSQKFLRVQEKVPEQWSMGIYTISENLNKSKECLKKIIDELES